MPKSFEFIEGDEVTDEQLLCSHARWLMGTLEPGKQTEVFEKVREDVRTIFNNVIPTLKEQR